MNVEVRVRGEPVTGLVVWYVRCGGEKLPYLPQSSQQRNSQICWINRSTGCAWHAELAIQAIDAANAHDPGRLAQPLRGTRGVVQSFSKAPTSVFPTNSNRTTIANSQQLTANSLRDSIGPTQSSAWGLVFQTNFGEPHASALDCNDKQLGGIEKQSVLW